MLIKTALLPVLASLFLSVGIASAADMEITPFATFNQSPLVHIFGIPHETSANIAPPGIFYLRLNHDLSSNYSASSTSKEQITLDGETYRTTFVARYGMSPGWEIGVDIPYISQEGGFLDSFIIDWHNTFGLPQGGRDVAARNKINYSYSKNGVQKMRVNQSASGLGDIALTGGFNLYGVRNSGNHDLLVIKAAVKVPTGDSSYLLGSGSTDIMLQLCGSTNRSSDWGSLSVFGSIGALAMSKSDVLRDQHNPLAGVATFGFGWGPSSWISFKAQLNGTTPLYRNTSLNELSSSSVVTIFGGALKFPGEYLLDIGVAEDIKVGTAPDVSFHLGLSKLF